MCLQETENLTSEASKLKPVGEDLRFTIVGATDYFVAICVPSQCDAGLSWRSDVASEFKSHVYTAACVV